MKKRLLSVILLLSLVFGIQTAIPVTAQAAPECLSVCMAAGTIPAASLEARAAGETAKAVETGLTIRESEINQLLTGDLTLPTTVTGLNGATVAYSVKTEDEKYVTVEGNKLKVTRPIAGEEDYKFTLKATVTAGGETAEKEFPLTVRAGLSDDSYAGYVYVSFASVENAAPHESWVDNLTDVQQLHFFLSPDGLNWTALNGGKPVFETGTDYSRNIVSYGANSINYFIADGTDVTKTTVGDASVLFPFEGNDQGVRDPYLIRGCREDGSDSNKVWLLATDLNTHADKYNGNKTNNICGDWSLTSKVGTGSTYLFIWETEDWVHWTRRYVDVGSQINAAMAWAPEAIYNPEKDNYLVYWSGRVAADGATRNRLYCCETVDFKEFGPTKLYEQEPFYEKYVSDGGADDHDGYGNIDTSQLWVAETKEDGTVNPYGTLYRVVKDETRGDKRKGTLLGIQLMSAKTVLDPEVDYDNSDPIHITPHEYKGTTYSRAADLSKLTGDTNALGKAEIVYNWFKNESTGNHFEKIAQKVLDKDLIGKWEEGATMFKFIDRDEWCVMIDNYGDMSVRYEPFVTTDLSKEDSITKVPSGGYSRKGAVGTHGGMIPVTVEEYNTMIDTYNADPSISNYQRIPYISVDTRMYDNKAEELKTASQSQDYSTGVKSQMSSIGAQIETAKQDVEDVQSQRSSESWSKVFSKMDKQMRRADMLLANKMKTLPADMQAEAVYFEEESVTICTKATDGLKKTATLHAEADIDSETSKVTFTSSKPGVVAVTSTTGVVTAKSQGSAVITATAPGGAKATCTVTVKGVPKKLTLKKKSVNLKVKKTYQIKTGDIKLPSGTVCSKFTYKSDKPKVASVSKTGKITAKKKGTAKITVTAANNSKAKAVLTVKVKK